MKKTSVTLSRLVLILLLFSVPALAVEPVKKGPEFIVNEYTTGFQGFPRVALHSSGSFVVVWDDYGRDGSYYGVFGRIFDSTGSPAGPSFQVNTTTFDYQRLPAVAMDDDGSFVVVWDDYGQDGDGYGIVGQLFDSAGGKVGGEFVANTYTTSWQRIPDVSMGPNGDFVVVWASRDQDGDLYGVFGQLFDSAGARVGGEFQVSTYTTSYQEYPRVSVGDTGDFVVVWESYTQDGSTDGIIARLFESGGSPVGGEFQVNSYTTFDQLYPVPAMAPNGDFVVTWDSAQQDGSGAGVFMRRFDSTGAPAGGDIRVNTETFGYQTLPAISMDAAGGFVVVWNSFDQAGVNSYYDVFAQTFSSTGSPLGDEFRVNTYTVDYQRIPNISMNDSGDFVVVWDSFYQDGDASGIVGQDFFAFGAGATVDITSPVAGSMVDCTNPKVTRPTFMWAPSAFDQFRFFMGSTAGFPTGTVVKSGKWGAITTTSYTPPPDKWLSACKKALLGGEMFLQVFGKDRDVSSGDAGQFGESDVVQVDVTFPATGLLAITSHTNGSDLDCSNPAASQPTFMWSGGSFDNYRFYMGTDPAFPSGETVKSGEWSKITSEMWTPSPSQWQSACQKALAANMGTPQLHLMVQGKNNSLPSGYPGKLDSSLKILVDADFGP